MGRRRCFRLLMDELEILASVVEDIEDPEMHERVHHVDRPT